MKMKKLLLTALALLSVLALTACGSNEATPETIKEKGKLVVAINPEFAPFEFQTLVNGKNTVVGSDVELAKAIADELGVKVEFSTMSFENVLSSLQSGKADLAISGISATKERAQAYDFSDSYYESLNKVVIRKADAAKYTSIASLADKSVAAQKGSVQEAVVKKQLPKSSLVSVEIGEMITELKSGKIEGLVLEEPIAKGYVAKNDDLMIADIQLASEESDTYAVALRKGSDQLKKAVNKVIKEKTSSGTYEQWLEEARKLSEQ